VSIYPGSSREINRNIHKKAFLFIAYGRSVV